MPTFGKSPLFQVTLANIGHPKWPILKNMLASLLPRSFKKSLVKLEKSLHLQLSLGERVDPKSCDGRIKIIADETKKEHEQNLKATDMIHARNVLQCNTQIVSQFSWY